MLAREAVVVDRLQSAAFGLTGGSSPGPATTRHGAVDRGVPALARSAIAPDARRIVDRPRWTFLL